MQKKWIERAKETYKFHRAKCILDDNWRLVNTAKALHRSLGSVCEDIKIAQWLKTHSEQINRFEFACEAIKFIRKKEKEIDFADLDV